MRIDVTEEDIQEGVKCDCDACPIARAVRRATGDQTLSVMGYGVYRGAMLIGRFPKKATDFVISFDSDDSVKPFSFNLDMRGTR